MFEGLIDPQTIRSRRVPPLIETLSVARFAIRPPRVPLSSQRHLHVSDKQSEERALVANDKQVIACRLRCEWADAGAAASLDMPLRVVCARVEGV